MDASRPPTHEVEIDALRVASASEPWATTMPPPAVDAKYDDALLDAVNALPLDCTALIEGACDGHLLQLLLALRRQAQEKHG